MKIEDSFTLNASRAVVWQAITDPAIVAPCVPGCEKVEILGPTTYLAEVKVKLGPIKAEFRLNVEVTKETPPEEVLSITKGEEGSKASLVQAKNILRLNEIDAETTEVFYSSEVSIVGRLGKFGFGIMKKKAKALGDEFAEAFRREVEKSPEPELSAFLQKLWCRMSSLWRWIYSPTMMNLCAYPVARHWLPCSTPIWLNRLRSSH